MTDLSALEAEVEEQKTVNASAIALLKGLSDQIKEAGTDAVKLKALTDALDSGNKDLATAVEANTPAA